MQAPKFHEDDILDVCAMVWKFLCVTLAAAIKYDDSKKWKNILDKTLIFTAYNDWGCPLCDNGTGEMLTEWNFETVKDKLVRMMKKVQYLATNRDIDNDMVDVIIEQLFRFVTYGETCNSTRAADNKIIDDELQLKFLRANAHLFPFICFDPWIRQKRLRA